MSYIKTTVKNWWKSLTNAEKQNTNLNNSDSEEEPVKENELITRREVKGTPFTIIGNKNKGYFVALGKYRLTEPTEHMGQAQAKLNSEKWDIIARLIITLIEAEKNMEFKKTNAVH